MRPSASREGRAVAVAGGGAGVLSGEPPRPGPRAEGMGGGTGGRGGGPASAARPSILPAATSRALARLRGRPSPTSSSDASDVSPIAANSPKAEFALCIDGGNCGLAVLATIGTGDQDAGDAARAIGDAKIPDAPSGGDLSILAEAAEDPSACGSDAGSGGGRPSRGPRPSRGGSRLSRVGRGSLRALTGLRRISSGSRASFARAAEAGAAGKALREEDRARAGGGNRGTAGGMPPRERSSPTARELSSTSAVEDAGRAGDGEEGTTRREDERGGAADEAPEPDEPSASTGTSGSDRLASQLKGQALLPGYESLVPHSGGSAAAKVGEDRVPGDKMPSSG